MAFAFEKEIISSYLPSRKGCDALLDVKALEDSVVIQAPLETLRPFLQMYVHSSNRWPSTFSKK